MSKKKHRPEEIFAKLRQVDVLRSQGRTVGDTPYVQLRKDTGRALAGSVERGALAAVLRNAILPHLPLAALAAEVALDWMLPSNRPDGWITFREGVRVAFGPVNAVDVDPFEEVKCIVVKDQNLLTGRWSLGMGFEANVLREGRTIASILYEPYMAVVDGKLQTIDGKGELAVSVRRCQEDPDLVTRRRRQHIYGQLVGEGFNNLK